MCVCVQMGEHMHVCEQRMRLCVRMYVAGRGMPTESPTQGRLRPTTIKTFPRDRVMCLQQTKLEGVFGVYMSS